ncbi:MAG: hypothetical protein CVV41_07820 [Candidatus Riflebacteria bacterium HGW-Riflebacteria-1]|jgi:hypothetical protein|nr:MAG: hypothetical protein CVV41_07820 [Candidatus Riflebacteria bacterium HGW-Riflebacteria-1]
MQNFTVKENQLIVDLMAILALKLILLPRPESDYQVHLATISIASAAETYVNDEILRPAVASLSGIIKKAVACEDYVKMADGNETLKQKLLELKAVLQQKVGPVRQKAISNFYYRFAYKLSSMAGKEFANIGRHVSAEDAGILLWIREILEIKEQAV